MISLCGPGHLWGIFFHVFFFFFFPCTQTMSFVCLRSGQIQLVILELGCMPVKKKTRVISLRRDFGAIF